MDTNLNNEPLNAKPKLLYSTITTIIIVLFIAVAAVGSYAPLKNYFIPADKHVSNYLESTSFAINLARITSYLKDTKIKEGNWYDSRYEEQENLKFFLANTEKNVFFTNLDGFEGELIDSTALEQELKNSQFYLQTTFDGNGNPTVESSLGKRFPKDVYINYLSLGRNDNQASYANYQLFFFVPLEIQDNNDLFINNVKEYSIAPNHAILILAIGALSLLLVLIIAASIPYSIQANLAICRLYNMLFLELKLVLMVSIFAAAAALIIYIGRHQETIFIINMLYDANANFYLIGIPITFLILLAVYLNIVYLKKIYHEGFKEGFIKNTIVGKLFCAVFCRLKEMVLMVTAIDFSSDMQKQLIQALLINFIALFIIAVVGGGFGIILAIAYSYFLSKYLIKLLEKLKALYDASSQLAKGEFNITLEEDLGLLSPIGKNLSSIKEGFKLAVDQEIKSERMKAELISNVSHDLKTPLTSIITYVDLLKNEDLDQQTKKEYVEVLDQKSKRLKGLIEDLFEASKASSGNVELHLEKVDVVALFRQTLGELEEKILQSSLDIKANIPENKINCMLDGKKTYRIFENIMSNIFKYAMVNSRVYIDVVETDQEVYFTFKNISAYEMNFSPEEITERFTRGDKSRSTEGSGLGLAIAKSLIELQDGALDITIDGDLFKLIIRFPKTI